MEIKEIKLSSKVYLLRIPLIFGLVGMFLLAFSSILMDLAFSIGFNEGMMQQFEVLIRLVAWVVIFTSLAMIINRYLKYGFEVTTSGINELNKLDASENNKKYSELLNRIEELESNNRADFPISNEEKEKMLNSFQDEFSRTFEDEIKEKIKNNIIDERVDYLRKNLKKSLVRLLKEVNDLSRRGNLNLIIGVLATLAGFLIFGMMVLDGKTNITVDNFLISFIPRFSLVILIEVFAYFFLSLYKSSLNEIKFFQNEITNIESKYSAMEYAVQYGDNKSINMILKCLANTERNFLLKKGESTVLLEQDKYNTNSQNSIIEKITDLFNAEKSSNK